MKPSYLAAGFAAICSVGLSLAGQALSQDAPLNCHDLIIAVSKADSGFTLNFIVSEADIVKQCKSQTAQPIMVVSPKLPLTVTTNTEQEFAAQFEVKDDLGNVARAYIRVENK